MAEPTKAPKRDLTAADAKAYVERGAGLCPFCDSHSITGGSFDVSDNVVWQSVDCADCNAVWQDIYYLARIDVRDTPDGRTFGPDGYKPTSGDDAAVIPGGSTVKADPYCAECREEGHDTCSLTPGCPCCDDTSSRTAEGAD